MGKLNDGRHPVFAKYTREWLSDLTGYSKIYLSHVASGRVPLSRAFIDRVSLKVGESEEELFAPVQHGRCLVPGGCAASALGEWLEQMCKRDHLSLRQAAAKCGLSHATISGIIEGKRPSGVTIKKLAMAFGGKGNQGLALMDQLLAKAGYRVKLKKEDYLEIIPLMSPEHQHVIEVLVMELAKVEGVETNPLSGNREASQTG